MKNLYFSVINEFCRYRVICVDGINGVGKSTITAQLNRKYVKINLLYPEIVEKQDYNFYPLNSLEYITTQLLHPNTKQCSNEAIVWDRDRYSNLRFYYVHYLMYSFRNEQMNIDRCWEKKCFESMNALAISSGLVNMLCYMETMHPSPPTLIILNSNLQRLGMMLVKRGTKNDVYNAKEINYQTAQHYVYSYFAKILQQPIVDLSHAFDTFGLNISETHDEIIKRLNYKEYDTTTQHRLSSIEMDIDSCKHQCVSLQNFCKNNIDHYLYRYSNK